MSRERMVKKKEADHATHGSVKKEMAKPRMAKSVRGEVSHGATALKYSPIRPVA
jgi:hypothetical protein